MNRWYADFAAQLDLDGLAEVVRFEFVGGGQGEMTRSEILLHVVNHGTYHHPQSPLHAGAIHRRHSAGVALAPDHHSHAQHHEGSQHCRNEATASRRKTGKSFAGMSAGTWHSMSLISPRSCWSGAVFCPAC
jgi:hypothetical protein